MLPKLHASEPIRQRHRVNRLTLRGLFGDRLENQRVIAAVEVPGGQPIRNVVNAAGVQHQAAKDGALRVDVVREDVHAAALSNALAITSGRVRYSKSGRQLA